MTRAIFTLSAAATLGLGLASTAAADPGWSYDPGAADGVIGGSTVGGVTSSGAAFYWTPGAAKINLGCSGGQIRVLPQVSARADETSGAEYRYQVYVYGQVSGAQAIYDWTDGVWVPYMTESASYQYYNPLTELRQFTINTGRYDTWLVAVQMWSSVTGYRAWEYSTNYCFT